MEIEKIEQIIKLFKQYELHNIYVESDNFKLRIEDYKNNFTNVKKINFADNEYVNSDKEYIIKSPLVGNVRILENKATCKKYAVGDEIKNGEVLCIVEAMKMLNEITCNRNGFITEILIKDNQFIEYGQPLFVIKESNKSDV